MQVMDSDGGRNLFVRNWQSAVSECSKNFSCTRHPETGKRNILHTTRLLGVRLSEKPSFGDAALYRSAADAEFWCSVVVEL